MNSSHRVAPFLLCGLAWLVALPPARAQLAASAYRVLGQPDLRHSGANTLDGASLNSPLGAAVDDRSGHTRLYIADSGNSRILAWRDVSAYQMGDPPDLVLGQPGLQYSYPLGLGAKGLAGPAGLAVSPITGDLYVADYGNHRVLRFLSPFDNPARIEPDAVFGQPNFTTRAAAAPSASTMNHPRSLAFDSAGNLWVADAGNNRIMRFSAASLATTNPSADTVIGQKDFTTAAANAGAAISGSAFDTPAGLVFDAQDNLYIADFRNARVLRFNAPVPTGMAFPGASLVWGQTGFAVRNIAAQGSASTMAGPTGVFVDANRTLYVTVPGENRILTLPADGPNGAAATTVIGQTDFVVTTANTGAAPLASAGSLWAPADVKADAAGNLFVADSGNHRVLEFDASAKTASRVWGQISFRSNGMNRIKPGSLFVPYKIAIDYSAQPFALYVSDTQNNRVLVWKDSARFRSGDPADLVIGQPDLFTGSPNTDSGQAQKPSAVTLSNPTGLAVDPATGALYVADSNNNRVLQYSRPVAQGGRITAQAVFGQPDFTSAGAGPATASSLNHPIGIAIGPDGSLFVADAANNRVLQFAAGARGASAIRVFGQPNMNTGQAPPQSTAQTLLAPQGLWVDSGANLYVADGGANRVVIYPNVNTAPTGGGAASFVIGTGPTKLKTPTDVVTDNSGNIFVADAANNRVLMFPSLVFLPTSAATATGVVGQPNLTTVTANSNSPDGLATPGSLYSPLGLYIDRQDTLYVADGGNNRAVHFLRPVAVVNAATMQAGAALARGTLAALFTRGLLADSTASIVDSSWPRVALNREVVVNDEIAAPIYFVNSTQANFQLPSNLSLGAQRIAVRVADTDELLSGGELLVASTAPGLFTAAQSGSGAAAALNQDLTVNSPSSPAAPGSTIVLYGTGQGQVSPTVDDGVAAPSSTLSNTVAVPTSDGRTCITSQPSMCVAIGSSFGTVTYSGLAPGFVGLWQINVTIPPNTAPGITPVRVLINGAASNSVTVAIR